MTFCELAAECISDKYWQVHFRVRVFCMSIDQNSLKLKGKTTKTDLVSKVYEKLQSNIQRFKQVSDKPLTLGEKILIGHLDESTDFMTFNGLTPGNGYILLNPDRVALQDVTGQTTILQFMQAGIKQVLVPTTVHCDHLIQARVGSDSDTKAAIYENNEVYQFLESASRKYGIGFWKPGAGIIHQVVLENYAFPGGLMIGTDSHTPNAGGLGMLAIGVGGLDAAEVMAGLPWEVLYPKRIGVYLTGKLNGWTSPKDIILYVASKLTVSGGTNAIIEYFGPGARNVSCTGKATITNMGAEIGATCSVFSYDPKMESYLISTGRKDLADIANKNKDLLVQDPSIEEEISQNRENASKYFDQLIEINLDELEPYIVGPHTPDFSSTHLKNGRRHSKEQLFRHHLCFFDRKLHKFFVRRHVACSRYRKAGDRKRNQDKIPSSGYTGLRNDKGNYRKRWSNSIIKRYWG